MIRSTAALQLLSVPVNQRSVDLALREAGVLPAEVVRLVLLRAEGVRDKVRDKVSMDRSPSRPPARQKVRFRVRLSL